MTLMHHKDVNMLEGPLIPKIIAFAIPLMLSNLLQVLYSAADMIIVRSSGVPGAVGAIGVTNTPIALVLHIFIGFSVGANVVVARSIGAKDDNRISVALHTSLLTGVLFGTLGGVLGVLFMPAVLRLMSVEGSIWAMASEYSQIRLLAMPLIALTNFCVAASRAKGDSTTPLIVLGISGALNVGANLLFVHVFHMDVDGVAWASNLASAFSAVMMVIVLAREEGPCRFSLRKLRIDPRVMWEVLRIGVPAGLQSAMYALSNTIITSSIVRVNNMLYPGGSAVIDGNSAASSIGSFVTTCSQALVISYVSFTSQHCGARKFGRLKEFFGKAYLCCIAFNIFSCSVVLLLRKPLLSLYLTEPGAFAAAETRMFFMIGAYLLCGLMECGSMLLRGMGWSASSAIITLITTCLFRVVWIYAVFPRYETLESIYLSYPISWLLAAVGQFITVTIAYRRVSRAPAPETAPAESV